MVVDLLRSWETAILGALLERLDLSAGVRADGDTRSGDVKKLAGLREVDDCGVVGGVGGENRGGAGFNDSNILAIRRRFFSSLYFLFFAVSI